MVGRLCLCQGGWWWQQWDQGHLPGPVPAVHFLEVPVSLLFTEVPQGHGRNADASLQMDLPLCFGGIGDRAEYSEDYQNVSVTSERNKIPREADMAWTQCQAVHPFWMSSWASMTGQEFGNMWHPLRIPHRTYVTVDITPRTLGITWSCLVPSWIWALSVHPNMLTPWWRCWPIRMKGILQLSFAVPLQVTPMWLASNGNGPKHEEATRFRLS